MDTARWQRLSPLLDVLLELDTDARAERLRQLAVGDPAMATELEALLALERDSADFMAEPVLKEQQSSQPGRSIGPYRLLRLLGEGGMGQVWLAERADGLYRRKVALKLLRSGYADQDLRLRFSREREILALLEHPNLARLLDTGVADDGRPYLALAYVEGVPITDYCREQSLSVEARLQLFQQVCAAVSHAHANLVVHRDLKPSNILVTASGEARVLDFGIAKLLDADAAAIELARAEARCFTLHYAAPEQVRGEPVTTRTDVYSLGVVLYELLAGTKPYRLRRHSDMEWERTILAVDPPQPSVAVLRHAETHNGDRVAASRLARRLAGDLDSILLKALAKSPEQRYASVEALALDLQLHLQRRPVRARPQRALYRLQKYLLRHRWSVLVGGLFALLLIAALSLAIWQARIAIREAARAQAMRNFVISLFDKAGGAAPDRRVDARELLALGEQRGERELALQPLAQAELQGVIARLHIGLGDYPAALALLEKQQRLIDRHDDAPASLRLESAALHGHVLRLMERSSDCASIMQPLAGLALRQQGALPEQAAEFYSQLGRCRRGLGEYATARTWADRSLALRRQHGEEAGMVENLADLAALEAAVGHYDAAIIGYRHALELLRAHAGQRHLLQVNLQRDLGMAYFNQGESAAAEQVLQEGVAVARQAYGPQHPATLALRRLQATVHADRGHLAMADREIRETHALTLRILGKDRRNAGLSWNALGLVALERGDNAVAVDALSRAVSAWRGAEGRDLLAYGLSDYARALQASGHYSSALDALRECRQLRIRRAGADAPVVGDTDRLIGEVQAAQGRLRDAQASFDDAARLTLAGYGAQHPRTLLAQMALARQLGRTGQSGVAAQQLGRLAGLTSDNDEGHRSRWLARAYAAEAHCRAGLDGAQAQLSALQDELRAQRPEGGAVVREVVAIQARCAGPQ